MYGVYCCMGQNHGQLESKIWKDLKHTNCGFGEGWKCKMERKENK